MNIIYGYIGNSSNTGICKITESLSRKGGRCKEIQNINNYFATACFNKDYPLTLAENKDHIVNCDSLLTNREYLEDCLSSTKPINDAELILKAYAKWGENIVHHIEGDFAVAIYNKATKETLLIRDHLGIKPLYYHIDQGGLFFTGDFHLLADNNVVKPSFTAESLCFQLDATRGDNYQRTPFDNIFRVKPASYIKFTPSQNTIKQEEHTYWNPGRDIKINHKRSLTQTVRELEQVIDNAVSQRSKEEKTGVHLSGGIDSTSIACKLSLIKQRELKAYSWSPSPEQVRKYIKANKDPQDFSEYKNINAACRKYPFDLSYTDYKPVDFYNYLSRPDYILQPVLEIPVLEKIKQDDIKLILSGWGGDEFFSFKNPIIWFEYFACLKGIVRIPYYLYKQPGKTISKLIHFSGFLLTPRVIKKKKLERIIQKENIIKDKDISKKVNKGSKDFIYNYFKRSKNATMQRVLDHKYLSLRTEVWNRDAYKYGIEYSFPLLDKNIIELMFSIPVRQMISPKYNRFLTRLACKDILPREILRSRHKNEHGRIKFSAYCSRENKEIIVNKLQEIKAYPMLKHIDTDKVIKNINKNSKSFINIDAIEGNKIIRLYNFAKKYEQLQ